jgi:hypothetical protein
MTKEELDNQLRAVLHMLLEINRTVEDVRRATDQLISRVQETRAKANQEPLSG